MCVQHLWFIVVKCFFGTYFLLRLPPLVIIPQACCILIYVEILQVSLMLSVNFHIR